MSDKELPEMESGARPLVAVAVLVLVAMFFFGLIGTVLFRGTPEPPPPPEANANLKQPAQILEEADGFRVRFETSAGPFVVEVHPEWSPRGATQFRELVEAGYFDDCRFFRVVPGFVVQFGLNGDPAETAKWQQNIPDDKVVQSNTKGTLTFATRGPNTRTTQLFINLEDNTGKLDSQGFSPFGKVIEGMENVEKINPEYGQSPDQGQITHEGNSYLKNQFPRLDFIQSAKIMQ